MSIKSKYITIDKTGLLKLYKLILGNKIKAKDFNSNKRQWIEKSYNIKRVESENHHFNGTIVTDGMAISVILYRVASKSVESKLSQGPKFDKIDRLHSFDQQIDITNKMIIGKDPGIKNIFTTIDTSNKVTKVKNKEYYHLLKDQKYKKWRERQLENDKNGLLKFIIEIPSSKTMNYKEYQNCNRYLASRLNDIIDFYYRSCYKRIRWYHYFDKKKRIKTLL